MSVAKVYKGDVGTTIDIDVQEVITGATGITWYVMKPGATVAVEWTGATIEGTTKMRYITKTGDQEVVGTYVIQAKLTLGSWTGRCDPVYYVVHDLFD